LHGRETLHPGNGGGREEGSEKGDGERQEGIKGGKEREGSRKDVRRGRTGQCSESQPVLCLLLRGLHTLSKDKVVL